MKTKLIQTKGYLLLIDEEAEIKEGDYQLAPMIEKIELADSTNLHLSYMCYKIIAYRPLTKEAKELDLPLLPNPFKEVDIDKIIDDKNLGYHLPSMDDLYREGFKEGYEAAQSKQFSLEDMKKAIEMAREYEFIRFGGGDTESKYTEEEIIQSLSTQQLPKEFILEVREVTKYSFRDNSEREYFTFRGVEVGDILIAKYTERGIGGDSIPFPMNLIEKDKEYVIKRVAYFGFWKVPWIIDEDGNQHIPIFDNFTLKNKTGLKTITNSEGKEEIVGIYKY